ncbi:hypothetical protein BC940DRAFT_303178 [Gongronella butleri]|nr:hypothetical protein BC940DRAFT_303178 [Gongronella butleri]
MTDNVSEEPASRFSVKQYQSIRFKLWLHGAHVAVCLLTVVLLVPTIIIQNQNGGSSAAVNYDMFVAVFTTFIPICMALFPWMYESKNKAKKAGKFFLKARTQMIFSSFYALLWLTGGIAITVQALNPASCATDRGDAWTSQCRLGYAAMATTWLNCLLWLVALVSALIVFVKEKRMTQKKIKQQQQQQQALGGDGVPQIEVADQDQAHQQGPLTEDDIYDSPHEQMHDESHYGLVSPAMAGPSYQHHADAHVYPHHEMAYTQQQHTPMPDAYPSYSTPVQHAFYAQGQQQQHSATPLPSTATSHGYFPPHQDQVAQQQQPFLVPPLASMPDPQHYRS